MKKTIVKAVLAVAMLFSVVLGQGEGTVAASSTTAKAPIMRDNLFKFGLEKDLELPVTVTSGGFSYTLEKIMIYDTKSVTAQALVKKYGYSDDIYRVPTKYMIWTKITIQNNSKKVIQRSAKDPMDKWFININGNDLTAPAPGNKMLEVNSKEALWTWLLKPGQKLTTYQMYGYIKDPTYIVVRTYNGGGFDEKFIVKRPGE